jgi:hypothetical protein
MGPANLSLLIYNLYKTFEVIILQSIQYVYKLRINTKMFGYN